MSDNTNPARPTLLPCPFCGKRPILMLRPDDAESKTYFASVSCFCDGHSTCAHKMVRADEPDEAEALVTAAWNRRTPPASPPVPADIAALAEECKEAVRDAIRDAESAQSDYAHYGHSLIAEKSCAAALALIDRLAALAQPQQPARADEPPIETLRQQLADLASETRANPGKAVSVPALLSEEGRKFMRGEPSLIDQLPFKEVLAFQTDADDMRSDALDALAALRDRGL